MVISLYGLVMLSCLSEHGLKKISFKKTNNHSKWDRNKRLADGKFRWEAEVGPPEETAEQKIDNGNGRVSET